MLAAAWACLTCSEVPSLRINSKNYSIVRLLGEGGFAYVYLVRQEGTDKLFALKKIRCVFGGESVANAMREVEAANVFRGSKGVVGSVDSSVIQASDGTKTVYLLLPYYANGTLQDKITENTIEGKSFSEKEVISYALGIARALGVMHHHRDSSPEPETPSRQRRSLDVAPEEEHLLSGDDLAMRELQPYAHRDIKPANVMLTGTAGEVVLVDLGSTSPARVHVETRQQALELQDIAAEHCTLPFRAPELFDVRTGIKVDEKVDIWGFGATLYTIMYSVSPFEREEQVAGANINIAVRRGKFSFPEEPEYSEDLRNVVSACLTVDPAERPTIDKVVSMLEDLQRNASFLAS